MVKPKIVLILAFIVTVLLLRLPTLYAQGGAISAQTKKEAIDQLETLLNAHYVFPEVAKATGAHLQKQWKAGIFDKANDAKTFAEILTREAQSVNKDKHNNIRPAPLREQTRSHDNPESLLEALLMDRQLLRESNGGIKTVQKLEGNIGYIELTGFLPLPVSKSAVESAMQMLSGSDAVIIDLRKNGGGDPATVQYLCSYFFNERLLLNSLYWREGDQTEEFWTLEQVKGDKLPDVPLFILTSNFTFSAAEEFSYNMQTRKRATLVGETTGGGANPGRGFPLPGGLMVFIPTGRAINPVTGTNWEGVGVIPEIHSNAPDALARATELAKNAAHAYRQKKEDNYKSFWKEFQSGLSESAGGKPYDKVLKTLQKSIDAGMLNEMLINRIGYDYLRRYNRIQEAELIFLCNTLLFPQSPNTYDSYGEALGASGNWDAAVKSYRKAVETALANGDENVEMYRKSLELAEQRAKGK